MCTVDILQIIREPVWFIECETLIPAGFPSPAEDERGQPIDLNKILLPHPTHTYLARVNGLSMDGPPSHIPDGALLAIDCSLKPQVGHIVVAAVDGEFTVKRLEKRGSTYWLVPDNPAHTAIEVRGKDHVKVWGVVTHVVTEMINGQLNHHVRTRRLQ
ncbi:LexA family protein [Hymenobacter arizonensis]|uniref:DNA polymerase V n=1 Tax=Hymenobacter arizonensis TaxID=1227077 RepID=A0A1I5YWR5_HYMAR|nr:translesion error-prone DNA polymerase V autoproteolytic subunit [Hymenobacter arizonensis]SFQ48455.1 DNA polymerase V [Hymenobacter arizonensis]